MQPDKKQLEVLILNYFRESYAEFPKGKTAPSESPDFIVSLKNHHILGIELTRLNPGNAKPLSDDERALNEFREQLIDKTKSLFEEKSMVKLFVKFLFSDTKTVKPESELITVVKTANAINDSVMEHAGKAFFRTLILKEKLPEGINEILVVFDEGMETSVWELSNNLGISTDVVDDIRKTILKKDEKLRLYRKNHLNLYWLLITTDRLRGVKNYNLPNKIRNHKFESGFQGVFLFDLMKADIYQLI